MFNFEKVHRLFTVYFITLFRFLVIQTGSFNPGLPLARFMSHKQMCIVVEVVSLVERKRMVIPNWSLLLSITPFHESASTSPSFDAQRTQPSKALR